MEELVLLIDDGVDWDSSPINISDLFVYNHERSTARPLIGGNQTPCQRELFCEIPDGAKIIDDLRLGLVIQYKSLDRTEIQVMQENYDDETALVDYVCDVDFSSASDTELAQTLFVFKNMLDSCFFKENREKVRKKIIEIKSLFNEERGGENE